jgi:hypothetical protein
MGDGVQLGDRGRQRLAKGADRVAVEPQDRDVVVEIHDHPGQKVAFAVAPAKGVGVRREFARGQRGREPAAEKRGVELLFDVEGVDADGDGRARIVEAAREKVPVLADDFDHAPHGQAARHVERVGVDPGMPAADRARQLLLETDAIHSRVTPAAKAAPVLSSAAVRARTSMP